MNKRSWLKLLLPLFIFTTTSRAQQFGGNPPSIKWKQINTKTANVIYSQGMDSSAMQIADIIQQMNPSTTATIGTKQRQVSIVLQNQTTISNGYVGLAPFRSEFYLTPEQNSFELGSLPWAVQLAIHEFRHVQQYNNFNVGLSHALKRAFGEGGQALGNDLSIPNWFFEGDAVYNETLVSKQGRGRLPYFFSGYRALWSAGRNYSWIKLRNGSYRDYVPDHYPMGYMMVAFGREKYGNMFWKNVTHEAASFNGLLYPFQQAVRKYSGKSYKQFRGNAFNYFKRQFEADKPDTTFKKNQHFIANQEYPAYVNDSTIIYLKTTYAHIPTFVLKTGKEERAIAVQDITTDNYFTYQDGKVVYAAYRRDMRWGYRNYNELVVLDVNTGKERRITRKTRYFSPSFSPDGKIIVAVEVYPSGKSELHLLNAGSGKLISVVPNRDGVFYTYPKFYDNGRLVSAVRAPEGKMSLALIDIKTGNTKYLLPFNFEPAGFLSVFKDRIFFTKTAGVNDRLFALSIKTGGLTELDSSAIGLIGAYQPAICNNKIAWVGLTAFGFRIKEARLDAFSSLKPDSLPSLSEFAVNTLVKDPSANLLASVSSTPLAVTNYSKAHNFLNFHSVFPTINDPNYSLALVGENVLNTFQSQLSVRYNRDERYKRLGYDATFGGLFPYMTAGGGYTFDRRTFFKGDDVYFNETDLHAGIQVPLNLTVGKHARSVTAGSEIYYSRNSFQQPYRAMFADRQFTYLNNFMYFSNQIQQAKQNINPRFAQSISINYKAAISNISASQFLISGSFYFPGLSINHSLVITAAHQQKGQKNAIGFSNDFPFSKGYGAQNLDDMNKAGVSYHFPVFYPDVGVADMAYLLRLRAYLFYDHTHASSQFALDGKPFKANFRSAGAALFFDTRLFNQGSVSFGVRYSYLLDPDYFGGSGRNRIELVLPVSLF